MSPTSSDIRLSPNAESVLTALSLARAKRDRTTTALKDECGLAGMKTEAALQELIINGLVEADDSAFALTEAGRIQIKQRREKKPTSVTYNNYGSQTSVKQNVGKVENSSVTMGGIQNASAKTAGSKMDVTATPLNFTSLFSVSPAGEVSIDKTMQTGTLPYLSAQAHPVRANSALPVRPADDRTGMALTVRFVLAFTSLRDGLPIPVFDQDKLGRSRENQISLPHDAYLSQHHCRFLVKKSRAGAGYEFFVEDLSSRNGTIVNDALIEPNKPVQIKHGSRLEIGGVSFVVVEIPA